MYPFDDTIDEPLDAHALGIVEEFERAWESARPDVGAHWERHPERPLRLLVELAAIDLENRLKRGEPATVEEYEREFPTLATDPALARELRRVAGRFTERRAADPDATGSPADPAAECDVEFAPSLFMDGAPAADPLVGTVVGGVSIVRVIAEGGMGRVYEGRQARPRRPVAVKVIKPGLTSPALLKRFEYEAQVLGRPRHPGIAQIHTVGTHQVGGRRCPTS